METLPVSTPASAASAAILREAEFDPAVKKYWMINALAPFVFSVVGIPLLPIGWLIGQILINKYLDRLACTLTDRTLEVRKGVLNRVQSTIPLEKITDLQMFQGPIMRAMGLHGFKVETAGQTTTGGALLSIVGIVDAEDFREAVLAQRDMRAAGDAGDRGVGGAGAAASGIAASPASAEMVAEMVAVLAEIRDAVVRIESKLDGRDRA